MSIKNWLLPAYFNEYWLKTMDNRKTYYFTIEAINENGLSQKSAILKVE